MATLQVKNINKAFGATKALIACDLTIEAGEVHVLIGANGCGKSTLCKIISGSVQADSGDILLNNQKISITDPASAQQHDIATFYQELSLAINRSIEDNIYAANEPLIFGLFIDKKTIKKDARKIIDLFADVVGDGFSGEVAVATLREDQRQLVEIMKVIAADAKIMIFDEPTSALDRAQANRFFKIIEDLKAKGKSIIFISHRMDEIFAIGDRITVMRDGQIVSSVKISDTDQNMVIEQMVGGKTIVQTNQATKINQSLSSDVAGHDVIGLELKNLTNKQFSNINLSVSKGEIIGLGGLHGHGQSSLLRSIYGAGEAVSGEITLEGQAYYAKSPRGAIKNGIGYISGNRRVDGIYQGRSIFENLLPIHYLKTSKWGAGQKRLNQTAQDAMAELKTLYASMNQEINNLSGGNQQKVVIARWMIDKTNILLLDDPTKGIDLAAKADLFALIRKLANAGMAIILYSSDDSELLNHATRIYVFNNGKISQELTGDQRTQFNLYQAAYEAV